MSRLGLALQAVLLVLAVGWCVHVARRWRVDVEELRSSRDAATRGAIVVWWIVTAVIAALALDYAVDVFRRILSWR